MKQPVGAVLESLPPDSLEHNPASDSINAHCHGELSFGDTRRRSTLRPFWKLLLLAGLLSSPGLVYADSGQCPPTSLDQISKQLESAREQLQLVDYPAALIELEKAEQLLPCANEAVLPPVLARFHMVRGLTMFYLGNVEGARNAFMRALSIDPTVKWDTQFGQRPRETFLDAREQNLSRPTVAVKCPSLANGVKVFVDGKPVTSGDVSTLPVGNHFLQITWTDGRWEGTFFDVTPGREDLLLPRQALKGESGGSSSNNNRKPPQNSEPSGEKSKLPLYVSAGVAGVGALSTIGFGLMYQSTWNKITTDFDSDDVAVVDGEVVPVNPDLVKLYNQHSFAAYATDISLVLTLAGAGTATWLFLSDRNSDDQASAPHKTWTVGPVFSPHLAGLVIQGQF